MQKISNTVTPNGMTTGNYFVPTTIQVFVSCKCVSVLMSYIFDKQILYVTGYTPCFAQDKNM